MHMLAINRKTKGNLFRYCYDSPCSLMDDDGNDAYWLTDTRNVGTMGHTSLLLQDNQGAWYYFYWGPEPGSVKMVVSRFMRKLVYSSGE